MSFTVIDHERERTKVFEDRDDAEAAQETAEDLADDPNEIQFIKRAAPTYDDWEPQTAEVVAEEPETTIKPADTDQPANVGQVVEQFDIDQDPLSVLPSWMKSEVSYSDRGDSSVTVNKRGCQVIAEYLGIEPEFTAVKRAHETDFEFATYECVVTKQDGRTFRGTGTARATDADQGEDAGWKLNMMAETRAYKRAVKAATGGGLEAFVKDQGASQ